MGKKTEQGNVIELVIIGVLVLVIAGLVVWRFIGNNDASNTTESTSETAQSAQGDGYVIIDTWGVRFKKNSSDDIQYTKRSDLDAYDFTTLTTANIPDCSNAWLWSVMRDTTKNDSVTNGVVLNDGNSINGYYYYAYHTLDECAVNSSVADQTTVNDQMAIVENFLETIEARQ